nr:cilia- and flagella-associated protein 251-like [Aegilops tauschii subsp. strangulata]
MWEFNPEGPRTLQRFYDTTHKGIWKLLFKKQKSWPKSSDDTGLDCNHPAFEAPVKKGKKKKREEGTLDAVSEEADAQSSHQGDDDDEEEEEEEDPPGKGKKRATSEDLEVEASKRDKITLSDDSELDAEAVPKHRRRTKPQADSALWKFKSCNMRVCTDGAAAVETLRGELAQAKEQARVNKAAADKAAADLTAEQAARCRFEERVTEVEQKLKDTARKCESLEEENKAKGIKLAKALQDAQEARSESRASREEIRQAGHIAAGKPFLLQAKFGDQRYALLNRVWSSLDAYADLPKSAADASQFFRAQEGYTMELHFWSHFTRQERSALLNDQMAQWAELHKMSSAAMRDVIVRLWPTEAIPYSYFGLVRRLVDALPRIDAVKRWSCIEGA